MVEEGSEAGTGWTLDKYASIDLVAMPLIRFKKDFDGRTVIEEGVKKYGKRSYIKIGLYDKVTIDGKEIPSDKKVTEMFEGSISCKMDGKVDLSCSSIEWSSLFPSEGEIESIKQEVRSKEEELKRDEKNVLFPDLGTKHAPELGMIMDIEMYKERELYNAEVGTKYLVDKRTKIDWMNVLFPYSSSEIPTTRGGILLTMEYMPKYVVKNAGRSWPDPTAEDAQKMIKYARMAKNLLRKEETKRLLFEKAIKDLAGTIDPRSLKGTIVGKARMVSDAFLLPGSNIPHHGSLEKGHEREDAMYEAAHDLFYMLNRNYWKLLPLTVMAMKRGIASKMQGYDNMVYRLMGESEDRERYRSILAQRAMDKNPQIARSIAGSEVNDFYRNPLKTWKGFTPLMLYDEGYEKNEPILAKHHKRLLESTLWTDAFVSMFIKDEGWVGDAKKEVLRPTMTRS